MDFTPQTLHVLLFLAAIVAGTKILRILRNAQEEGSVWVLKSKAFEAWTEKRDAKVTKEAEETRNLIRDFRDELSVKFEDLKDLYATRVEVEKVKGRTRTLEALNQAQHGVALPGDSSTFAHGDRP